VFGQQQAVGGDATGQRVVLARVDAVEAGADDGDRAGRAAQRAFVGGAVDALRQPGDDDQPRLA